MTISIISQTLRQAQVFSNSVPLALWSFNVHSVHFSLLQDWILCDRVDAMAATSPTQKFEKGQVTSHAYLHIYYIIYYILVDSTFSLSTQNSKVGHLQLEAEMAECIQRHLSNEAPHPEKCRCVCFLLELKIWNVTDPSQSRRTVMLKWIKARRRCLPGKMVLHRKFRMIQNEEVLRIVLRQVFGLGLLECHQLTAYSYERS